MAASSATLIDHMYTNLIILSFRHHFINDVADHFGTFCLFKGKNKHIMQASATYRSFSPENVSKFKTTLVVQDFYDLTGTKVVQRPFCIFCAGQGVYINILKVLSWENCTSL